MFLAVTNNGVLKILVKRIEKQRVINEKEEL